MSDDQIRDLIRLLKPIKQKFDRKHRFEWETRHLTPEARQLTEKRLRELWNESH